MTHVTNLSNYGLHPVVRDWMLKTMPEVFSAHNMLNVTLGECRCGTEIASREAGHTYASMKRRMQEHVAEMVALRLIEMNERPAVTSVVEAFKEMSRQVATLSEKNVWKGLYGL